MISKPVVVGTGDFFSFEFSGVQPDLICLSKSLSGYGLPFSLLLISPEHDQWNPAEDNGTFRGNTLAFVSATAAIREYWLNDGLQKDIRRSESMVRSTLQGLVDKMPESIKGARGRGLFYGLEFFEPAVAELVADECFRKNLIIERCGADDQVLKIMPALNIDELTLMKGLQIVAAAVEKCASCRTDEGGNRYWSVSQEVASSL